MTTDQIRTAILGLLAELAPEVDTAALRLDEPLRDQVDLDSMDFLNLVIGVHETFAVDIPEGEYSLLASVDDLVTYVARAGSASGAGAA